MSLKEHFMRKLRARVWANGRQIVRLRKRALDAEKVLRRDIHDQIDDLKTERERDIATLDSLCGEDDGVLAETRAGVGALADGIRHSLGRKDRD